MKDGKKERWMELCERAADELDSDKLRPLVLEIDHLLQEKTDRLRGIARREQR
jgi:hypothetical protein